MAITTEDGLYAALASAPQRLIWRKPVITTVAGSFYSSWKNGGVPAAGASPASTAGVTCSSATQGAAPFTNPAAGKKSCLSRLALVSTPAAGHIILLDRLVHSDGLSANVTTVQAVGTPTLPRHTDGVGVEIWMDIYSPPGASSAVPSVTYTNSAGVTGRVATPSAGIQGAPAGRTYPIPLQAGDVGVLSVQSVQFTGASGSAGNVGITLACPVLVAPVVSEYNANTGNVPNALGPHQTLMAQVQDGACLYYHLYAGAGTSFGPTDMAAILVQG